MGKYSSPSLSHLPKRVVYVEIMGGCVEFTAPEGLPYVVMLGVLGRSRTRVSDVMVGWGPKDYFTHQIGLVAMKQISSAGQHWGE